MRTPKRRAHGPSLALLAVLLLAPLAPSLVLADDDDAAEAAAEPHSQADSQPPADARARAEQRLKDAQRRMEVAAREMADLSLQLSGVPDDPTHMRLLMHVRRAQLGMAIDSHVDAKGEKPMEGVHVISVTPGGPAEAAGVRANDLVTSLNGSALKGDASQSPARQLLAILQEAKPGEPLAIEFRHEGRLVKARVVPHQPDDEVEGLDLPELQALHGLHDGQGFQGFPGMRGPGGRPLAPGLLGFVHSGGFGGTELVELSPGLGSYFGTDKGLLVVRGSPDARFKLQDGDVILDIDGRVPTGVGHAMQILGSYHAGETVKLHLMRQKQRLELAVVVPEGN